MKNFSGKEMLDVSDWVRQNFLSLRFRKAYADLYWDDDGTPNLRGWFSVTLTGIKASEIAKSTFFPQCGIQVEDWFGNPSDSKRDRHFMMMIWMGAETEEISKKILTHFGIKEE